ncbi:MAG TPA: hypothetical protein VGP26_01035 [Actinophytocola sp.]|jgi:hypothetical protein|nr:hypothetical protein [Actinophytocola sp.]
MRWVFAVAGVAALAWGGRLLWDLAARHDAIQVAFFFAGGPVVHDAIVAPAVGIGGLVLARALPPPARVPVALGAVLSGVLVLLAVPLVWRPFGVAVNPGLHDGNYVLGLGIALGVVWLGVAAFIGLRHKTSTARGRARG